MATPKKLVKVTIPQEIVQYAKEVNLPYITHRGVANIGDAKLRCAVLSDGNRIFTENSLTVAILGTKSGLTKNAQIRRAVYPRFLLNKSLEPFISQDLIDGRFRAVTYVSSVGVIKEDYGIDILVDTCNIWLTARDAGALLNIEMGRAYKAEVLLRNFARTGVAAIVDEATGYQTDRDQAALQKLLSKYLSDELTEWAKRFPDTFYQELFRLYGWNWKGKNKKPSMVGKVTNVLVYKLLPPGLLEELQTMNPIDPDKNRRLHKHHQFLSPETGRVELAKHLSRITAIMQLSPTFNAFEENIHKLHPECEALPKPSQIDE